MRTPIALATTLALVLLAAPAPVQAAHCGPDQPVHTYGLPGSATATTAQTGTFSGGATTVFDTSTVDCDGNGLPDDFDGDYETGVGGGFFGIAGNEQWNADCALGLHLHQGTTVTIADAVFDDVAFAAGYEGFDGDDPIDPECGTDGIIGDDANDCLKEYRRSAPVDPCAGDAADTHGVNADAGIWIFIACGATDQPRVDCAVTGTILVE